MKEKPLISVCIPNYNYGHYLENCLDSLLKQTYTNFEIHFSDNASTDNSYEIAQEYRKKFMQRGIYFNIRDNKRNLGSDKNSQLASRTAEGDFIYTLASDDAINPTFFERCMEVLDEYPNVVEVLVNREEIDENGNITKTVPFYNQSCVIPGESQAAVYMLAGIAIPAQRMYRRTILPKIAQYERVWNVAGDWYNNFLHACVGDIAYLKEDLVQYRVHTGNETSESEKKLLGITEHYQLIHAFVDIAAAYDLHKPQARYEEAVRHLGDMCLRYTMNMLRDNQLVAAKKYMQLAPVYKPEIIETEKYKKLWAIVSLTEKADIMNAIQEMAHWNIEKRIVSYDPPEGYQPIF